jgi:hypothetical protein
MTRRRVNSPLGPVRRDVCSEPITRWNSQNLMERQEVDVGVSMEFERQPTAPYVIGGSFEDGLCFGRRRTGSDAELVQPVL